MTLLNAFLAVHIQNYESFPSKASCRRHSMIYEHGNVPFIPLIALPERAVFFRFDLFRISKSSIASEPRSAQIRKALGATGAVRIYGLCLMHS